ncbi:putative cation efflux protein [Helianthus annuus]|nr:putative cation efflux protein [Helianthus annuus]
MQMDPKHDQRSIDISTDTQTTEKNYVASKVCAGAACGFSDAKTSSKDAEERSSSTWKLLASVVICFLFMAVEVVGGLKANSLAILTDAAHLLSDVAAFAISLFSVWASGWEATPQQSYGFFRIEILGTLVSIQMIWLLTGILVYEAVDRLVHGTVAVEGGLMFIISTVGLFVNVFMIFILGHDHGHGHHHAHHDHNHEDEGTHVHGLSVHRHQHSETHEPLLENKTKRSNINVQGAYLHVLGDLIQSIGVMIGAAIIWYNPKWKVVDPICTLLFSIIVLYTTINMLRDILEVLMESTPREIDATRLENGLCEIDEVVAIHELHIWAITVGKVLLACHVKIRREANADMVLDKVVDYIRREYNISHVTIQIERE